MGLLDAKLSCHFAHGLRRTAADGARGILRPTYADRIEQLQPFIRVAKLSFLWRKGISKQPFTLRLHVPICSRFQSLMLTMIPCIEQSLAQETSSTGT
jgi:hypothetical protein